MAEQIAELNFKLTRIEQKLSNHASDLAAYAHFKQQVTGELRIQKKKMESAEMEVKPR